MEKTKEDAAARGKAAMEKLIRQLPRRYTAEDAENARRRADAPQLRAWDGRSGPPERSLAEGLAARLPTGAARDAARVVTHGLGQTGNMILRTLDLPNRIFGNTRSRLQDWYEESERNMARDRFEDTTGAAQTGATAVHLASAGVFGKALPAAFAANVGADTYETAKYAGASEGEALAKGVGHGVVDTAIWTLGQGLASKYLPKAWQWLGREIIGAGRGAASSVTSDAVLSSLGADISGEEMAKRAVHAAWMVPLLGMLKMGGKRREEAMSLLRKARPDLAGERADKVVETIEAEFSDPKSQKVALAWVARKGANLPDDTAQIRQALEVSSKVKGLDPMSRSPFEILSNPAYARYLPKPRPQDVKAFSNMKRYPMGVIGFDVSDDAAGRQATREMINAYMSPSSNPWCLATGKDAAKLGELGPGAESYWKQHSAVPKQIFFQEVDGKLELTAFRATSPGGEGRQEYWDTSDAGYSGIPIKVKVPGDPMGRYRKMVFRPADSQAPIRVKLPMYSNGRYSDTDLRRIIAIGNNRLELERERPGQLTSEEIARQEQEIREARQGLAEIAETRKKLNSGEVQGTFEDIAPGKIFKGDPFRDGRSQTWVQTREAREGASSVIDELIRGELNRHGLPHNLDGLRELRRGWTQPGSSADSTMLGILDESIARTEQWSPPTAEESWVLVEDKVRTTENGITKFRTMEYADPANWNYEPPKPGEQPKPEVIEESELVSPEWMRSRGYDPESESDVRRMQSDLNIRAWGDGVEAAMAVVPTRRTYMQTKSGTPETVTYWPNGRDIASVDFEENGVPYRQEYFRSGPKGVDASTIYHTIDPDDFPMPTRSYGRNTLTPSGFRLVREPEGEFPMVLNEVKWDDGLGGFVRTSGNRRWRMGVKIRPKTRQDDPRYNDMPGTQYIFEPEQLIIEDLQPDGTWAPAMDTMPDGTRLPPPPPAVRQADTNPNYGHRFNVGDDVDGDVPFALKAGRTRRNVRAAEGGGDAGSGTAVSRTPVSEAPRNPGGPRIVINPKVFKDKRDALCVAFNEAFRLVMEENGFEPASEPTEKQRRFFADTAYADDELQLRRTILARIATLDTSVSDPTDEQLEETAEMLEMVMEVGAPQNEWEQSAVQRLHDFAVKMRESPRAPAEEPAPPREEGAPVADEGGGVSMTQAELDWLRRRADSGASLSDRQRQILAAADAGSVPDGKAFVTVDLDANRPQAALRQDERPQAGRPGVLAGLGWEATATGGGLQRPDRRLGIQQSMGQDAYGEVVGELGGRMPSKSELEWLRKRQASGASLTEKQRRILDLTAGMAT